MTRSASSSSRHTKTWSTVGWGLRSRWRLVKIDFWKGKVKTTYSTGLNSSERSWVDNAASLNFSPWETRELFKNFLRFPWYFRHLLNFYMLLNQSLKFSVDQRLFYPWSMYVVDSSIFTFGMWRLLRERFYWWWKGLKWYSIRKLRKQISEKLSRDFCVLGCR